MTHPRSLRFLVPLMLVAVCTGCPQAQSSKTELTMQVEPAGQPGTYSITGSTNLPDRTQITIQAVRDLRVGNSSSLTNQEPIYSILAREQVEVANGKWQTTLNLLQPTPGGQPLEAWQVNNPQAGLNLEPDTRVAFLAVTNPVNRSLDIEQQSGNSGRGAEDVIVRFTADGKSYLQSKQILSIDPPKSQAAASAKAPNGNTNQKASVVKVEAVSKSLKAAPVTKSQVDAPLSPEEFLR